MPPAKPATMPPSTASGGSTNTPAFLSSLWPTATIDSMTALTSFFATEHSSSVAMNQFRDELANTD